MRLAYAAAALFALAAACSAPDDEGAPPATPDEQRALAEARSMIPAEEIAPEPTPVPPSGETSTP